MASGHEAVRGLYERSHEAALKGTPGVRLGSGAARVSFKPVFPRELLVVEMPLLAILTMMFAVTLFVSPGQSVTVFGFNFPSLLICPFFELSGVPCLMCGITRSFLSMGGGDIANAFIFHPLGPLFYLVLMVAYAALSASVIVRRRFRISIHRHLGRWMASMGMVVLVAAWLVKLVIWHRVGLM